MLIIDFLDSLKPSTPGVSINVLRCLLYLIKSNAPDPFMNSALLTCFPTFVISILTTIYFYEH